MLMASWGAWRCVQFNSLHVLTHGTQPMCERPSCTCSMETNNKLDPHENMPGWLYALWPSTPVIVCSYSWWLQGLSPTSLNVCLAHMSTTEQHHSWYCYFASSAWFELLCAAAVVVYNQATILSHLHRPLDNSAAAQQGSHLSRRGPGLIPGGTVAAPLPPLHGYLWRRR
jgi:hypothetical protein